MLECEAVPAPRGTLRYLLASLLEGLPALIGLGGGEEPESPKVVVRRATGETTTIMRAGTLRQARREAARIEAELREVGPAEFVRRYRLPSHWAD